MPPRTKSSPPNTKSHKSSYEQKENHRTNVRKYQNIVFHFSISVNLNKFHIRHIHQFWEISVCFCGRKLLLLKRRFKDDKKFLKSRRLATTHVSNSFTLIINQKFINSRMWDESRIEPVNWENVQSFDVSCWCSETSTKVAKCWKRIKIFWNLHKRSRNLAERDKMRLLAANMNSHCVKCLGFCATWKTIHFLFRFIIFINTFQTMHNRAKSQKIALKGFWAH